MPKCMWSEQLNLLQISQNIYVIVQNIYHFALISLSISLSWSVSGLFCCVSQLFRFRSWPRGSRYQSVLYQKPKWCLKIEIIVKHSLHTFSWMSPCLSWLVQTAFLCFLLSERSSTINKVKAGYKANGPSPHEECGRQTLFCPCAI